MTAWLRWAFVLAACIPAWAPAQPARVVDLPTRPAVTQRLLVLQPADPVAVVLLMPGGAGAVGIDGGSRPTRGGGRNFLVRSRERFAQEGLAVAVLDLPSDRSDLNGSFRESHEHVQDIGAAVQWARATFGKPVWLVGTSRGTHSVSAAALALQGAQAPDGIVLSSSILGRSGRGLVTARPLPEMPLEQLVLPVLVVHHAQDPCTVCDPAQLPALMARLPAGRSTLVTFTGGQSTGAPCDPFSHHGYNGIEDRVVADIAAWIRARR